MVYNPAVRSLWKYLATSSFFMAIALQANPHSSVVRCILILRSIPSAYNTSLNPSQQLLVEARAWEASQNPLPRPFPLWRLNPNNSFWGDNRLAVLNFHITGFIGDTRTNDGAVNLVSPTFLAEHDVIAPLHETIRVMDRLLPDQMFKPSQAPIVVSIAEGRAAVIAAIRTLFMDSKYFLREADEATEKNHEAIRIHELLHLVFSDTMLARALSGENRVPLTARDTGIHSISEELYIEYLKAVKDLQTLHLLSKTPAEEAVHLNEMAALQYKINNLIPRITLSMNPFEQARFDTVVKFEEVYSDFGAAVQLKDPRIMVKALETTPREIQHYIRDFSFDDFAWLLGKNPGIEAKLAEDPHIALLETRQILWKFFYTKPRLKPGQNFQYDRWVMGQVYEAMESLFEVWTETEKVPKPREKVLAMYMKLVKVRKLIGYRLARSKVEAKRLFQLQLESFYPHENAEFIAQRMAEYGESFWNYLRQEPDYVEVTESRYGGTISMDLPQEYTYATRTYRDSPNEATFNQRIRYYAPTPTRVENIVVERATEEESAGGSYSPPERVRARASGSNSRTMGHGGTH